jgi:hypothetical protein
MTGGAGIWISGRCQVTVNDDPSPERAPGDASACAEVESLTHEPDDRPPDGRPCWQKALPESHNDEGRAF